MIPVIYVQLFVAVVWGYIANDFWKALKQDDEPGTSVRFLILVFLSLFGVTVGRIGGLYD